MTMEDEFTGPYDPTAHAGWLVDPSVAEDADADRELSKLADLLAQDARDRRLVEARIVHFQNWFEERSAPRAQRIKEQEFWLRNYHACQLHKNPKRVTINLPAGTLAATKAQPRFEFPDDAALAAWLETNHPEVYAVAVTKVPPTPSYDKVDKGKLKPHLDTVWDGDKARVVVKGKGEVVPGVSATPGAEKIAGVPRRWEAKPNTTEDE